MGQAVFLFHPLTMGEKAITVGVDSSLSRCGTCRNGDAMLCGRKAELDEFGTVKSLLDQCNEIEATLDFSDVVHVGSRAGMRWDEETAAILIRLDGYLKRADPLSLLSDFDLIHADQRTQDRQTGGFFYDAEILGCL